MGREETSGGVSRPVVMVVAVIVLENVFRPAGHADRNSPAVPGWVAPVSKIDLITYYNHELLKIRSARLELTRCLILVKASLQSERSQPRGRRWRRTRVDAWRRRGPS